MGFRPSRIRTRRVELGLTQAELATAVHVSQKQISNWETGTHPTSGYFIRLAKALECSADYLLGLSDDPLGHLRESDLSPDERQLIMTIRNKGGSDTVQEILMALAKAEMAKRRKVSRKR